MDCVYPKNVGEFLHDLDNNGMLDKSQTNQRWNGTYTLVLGMICVFLSIEFVPCGSKCTECEKP